MPRLLEAVALRAQAWRDTARAMSEENVKVMRRIYDAMARGDFWSSAEVFDPEIEWEWSAHMSGLTGVTRYHGIAGVEAATRDVLKAWDVVRQEAEEFIEVGDSVLVLTRQYGRLRGTDREIETRGGELWTFRNGKVIWHKSFDSPEEALEAAGLSE